MACEGQELSGLPVLLGCPSDTELLLVVGAIGGQGAGGYALRSWANIKKCITSSVSPFIGVVDRGNPNDPVSGTPIFQNDLLIGLGSSNNGNIQMVIDEILMSTFGQNKSFDFDPITGTVDMSYSGNNFQPLSGVFIDRNQ